MNITKFGHSCLLVEEGGARILIDPGSWSTGHTEVAGVHAILLTHEHADHTDPASLRLIREKNPKAVILANDGVGKILGKEGIPYERFVHGDVREIGGVRIEAHGRDHAVIYPTLPIVQNTSFLIAGRLFVTGDAFFMPPTPVDILALPVCAPWLRLAEAIDYAARLAPKVCFPVHDGMLKHVGSFHRLPGTILEGTEVQWRVLEHGKTEQM